MEYYKVQSPRWYGFWARIPLGMLLRLLTEPHGSLANLDSRTKGYELSSPWRGEQPTFDSGHGPILEGTSDLQTTSTPENFRARLHNARMYRGYRLQKLSISFRSRFAVYDTVAVLQCGTVMLASIEGPTWNFVWCEGTPNHRDLRHQAVELRCSRTLWM